MAYRSPNKGMGISMENFLDPIQATKVPSHLEAFMDPWTYESGKSDALADITKIYGIGENREDLYKFIDATQKANSSNFGAQFIPKELKGKVDAALKKYLTPPEGYNRHDSQSGVRFNRNSRDFYREMFRARNQMVTDLNAEVERRNRAFRAWSEQNEKYLGRLGTILPGARKGVGSGIEGVDLERGQLRRAGSLLGRAKGAAASDI